MVPRDPDTLLWPGRNFSAKRILVGRFVRGPIPYLDRTARVTTARLVLRSS